MANYLPVLMHSVTMTVPDDSSLETQARGQVDYLSHEWTEEDVSRSWRNMTKQKNEISNGIRLENASWRTWWKQRNKLKTINPESLNWLKDSDVTWLYGPLHTAVQWTPPPRPTRDETERKPQSAQDRLDLSMPKYKSILKYRTISQLLTSDLPSPLYSPPESDGEGEGVQRSSSTSPRPPLVYTKSDSHITRWPDRNFRRDSPPRIERSDEPSSPTEDNTRANSRRLSPSTRGGSSTNLASYFASQSSSSGPNSTSVSPGNTSSELPAATAPKKKHITFNTFVEQCIAIDKPKSPSLSAGKGPCDPFVDTSDDADDDGYDEDIEGGDELEPDWTLNECAITDSDDSEYEEEVFIQDHSDDDDDEEEELGYNEGVIEMRASRHTKIKNSSRSKSKASTSSSSSADSGSSSSAGMKARPSIHNIPRRRRSGTGGEGLLRSNSSSTARPSFSSRHPRRTSDSSDQSHVSQMVTIAPIAPTMLKTGSNCAHPAHYPAWDGFGIHAEAGSFGGWMDSFGDEGLSDSELNGALARYTHHKGWRSSDSDHESPGTPPVELVYVPPPRFGSNYGSRSSSTSQGRVQSNVNGSEAEVELMEEADESRRLDRTDSVLKRGSSPSSLQKQDDKASSLPPKAHAFDAERLSNPVPVVVRTPPVFERSGQNSEDEDAYDYFFEGPDLGEDYAPRRHDRRRHPRDARHAGVEEDRKSRSQSRSHSRTPSPQASVSAIAVPSRKSSSPPSTSSALLSPPQRGRSQSNRSPDSSCSRGRSSTRTSSSSLSDRERPRSRSNHTSPIGSLSPDGSTIGLSYGIYANGRIGDRDREGERDRGTQRRVGRGRERTERRLSNSLSPDEVISTTPVLPSTSASFPQETPASPSIRSTSETSETPSSSSSSQTIIPQINSFEDVSLPIVPSNSPVISMDSAAMAIAGGKGSQGSQSPTSPRSSKMKLGVPIDITQPLAASPKTSYIVNPPSIASSTPQQPQSPPQNETDKADTEDASIVGKAVGYMSSARAYLGLWNNHGGDKEKSGS